MVLNWLSHHLNNIFNNSYHENGKFDIRNFYRFP